jgi:hypothetical protein
MNPYIKPHGIEDLKFKHFDDDAAARYDPPPAWLTLEYEWVRANCDLSKPVIDAGCHHGHYSVVFNPAFVVAVDTSMSCCHYARSNMELNDMRFSIQMGMLGEHGIKTNRKPGTYRANIAGAEFFLFPRELKRFPSVKVWIVEIHPLHGNPDRLAGMFLDAGFDLLKVDRDEIQIRPYGLGERWHRVSTLIARKV